MSKDVNKSQRLCIYITYNKEHKVKEYMGYMLKALKECATKLYVVCNYPEILDGYDYISPYADFVFYRENIGYDAGAYKDALCTLIGWDTVYEYDELILVNDSFLGPFWDLTGYFTLMREKKWDYWGMTRQFSGVLEPLGYKYRPHVQSYFLVLSKKVFKSFPFRNFWEKFTYPKTFDEAILNFELKFNEYLEDNGFISMTLTDVEGATFKENEIAFLLYPYELVKDLRIPILKKNSVLIHNKGFANALQAIAFIEDQNLYPKNLLWELVDSQFCIGDYSLGNVKNLEQFYVQYNKIYIYGAGVCGKNLALYFEIKGWKQNGILVSDKAGQDIECTVLEEAEIDDQTGIIISVIRKAVSEEIVKYIETKTNCKREQLFIIYECRATGHLK